MRVLGLLIPVTPLPGGVGLAACSCTMRAGRYDDLKGAAHRIPLATGEDDATQP